MPKYGVSSLGRSYVVDEQLDELPFIRKAFMVITFLLGIITLLRFLIHLHKITGKKDKTCNYRSLNRATKRIIICYITSHLIHTIHFIDNIYRPVDYFEPKWLYDRVLLSEMEITFFANFPITLAGLIVMERFSAAVSKRNTSQTAESCRKIGWYIFGSLLTLGHYRTEPPWKYSVSTTFTIAGEGFFTILLGIWMYRYYKTIKRLQQFPEDQTEDNDDLINAEKDSSKIL